MYICPRCSQSISTEVKTLIWHLREIHALSDGQDLTIICSQDGCPRMYHNFNSFSKHLHRDHQSTPPFLDNVSNIEDSPDFIPCKTAIPSDCVASFLAKMYSSSNTTLMDVTKSVSCTQEMLERTVESLQHSTTTLLNNLQVPLDSESVQSLMSKFENAKTVFKDVDTPFK